MADRVRLRSWSEGYRFQGGLTRPISFPFHIFCRSDTQCRKATIQHHRLLLLNCPDIKLPSQRTHAIAGLSRPIRTSGRPLLDFATHQDKWPSPDFPDPSGQVDIALPTSSRLPQCCSSTPPTDIVGIPRPARTSDHCSVDFESITTSLPSNLNHPSGQSSDFSADSESTCTTFTLILQSKTRLSTHDSSTAPNCSPAIKRWPSVDPTSTTGLLSAVLASPGWTT